MSLQLENVSFVYNPNTAYETRALRDVSFFIEQGEFVAVIGHTGSGKSTLVQLMNALEKPTEGRVLYNGRDVWGRGYNRRKLRFKVGLVFQYPEHQFFEETVFKDVCFGPKNRGCSDSEAAQLATIALKQAGVPEEDFEKSPFELSGGVKRRAAIAGVLAMDPKVLILDEPTAGLDPAGRKKIMNYISELHKARKITVILVTHSMEDAARYARRIIVLNKGEKVMDSTPKTVFSRCLELESMHLCAPQVTYVMRELKKRGLLVDTSAITVQEAKNSILKALGRRGVC